MAKEYIFSASCGAWHRNTSVCLSGFPNGAPLFALEDIYALTVSESDGEICLKVCKGKNEDAAELPKMLCVWKEQADKLSSEEISREDYDQWLYNYPKFDTTQHWAKAPSKELSDALLAR